MRSILVGGMVATSRISEVEVASALARRCREGGISETERDWAIQAVRQDLRSLFVVEVTASVNHKSISLLKRHPLRAADALQLASCLELAEQLPLEVRFVAFDSRLHRAAAIEGLAVLT